ncbi:hypothetical protein Ciccas_013582, partial [Cichlidogyrus casuarinus]
MDEECEPKLSYKRLKFQVSNIVLKDSVTCMATHSKFISLGTSSGAVHVLDHIGSTTQNGEYKL